MSEAGDAAAPRRSQRERKKASHFVSAESQSNKRKRSQGLSEDEAESSLSELEASDAEEQDADVEEDFNAPQRKPKAKQPSDKPPPKKRGPPAAKKPRTAKNAAASSSKPKKPSTGRRGRRPATGANFDADQVAKDTKIANDNTLFSAIMNPSAALQTTAEDFLDSLTQTAEPSQAELITCILRACGCNHTLNADEALDYDGVLDALDHITEALKQDDTPVYPLTSKLPAFKKFRKSLSEFLSRLISSAAALELLYTTDLLTTLQTWVVAMSSSHLRAFRHTATVVALEVETALCEVAADVEKQAETVSRQREGERKRKKGKSEPPTARERELEGKAALIREHRTKLAEFLKEFVDGVFIHRYRDLDPNIRAECVRAMGLWFSKYPAHFLDGTYLRYVGWVLSDANTHVRQEAVKALSLAYDQTEYIGIAALQHFTERFKPRLVEMALGDTELSVRIAVVQVLHAIDGHGLLEDDQREKLCLLVFDEETRMRKAVSAFVKGVWQETVNERLVGKKPDAKERKKVGIKALAMLLVHWGRALDKGINDEDDMEDAGDLSEGSSRRGRGKEVAPLVGLAQKGRTALAVEALWDEVEPVTDWETILDTLLADHSVPGDEEASQRRGRKKGKPSSQDTGVDETWRLEEVEEGVLLEVLLASLRKTQADVKKGEEDIISSDITRALMKTLPTLFIKYQTDPGRMSDVLQLVQIMNLDMYLEMRMMTAYSSLWDDVIKQFMSHSVAIVLNNAVTTIRYMMDATSLANTNSTKILELEEELATSLRDTLKGRDELELASFDEDEILALTAICARLATLAGARDITAWMEEDEGGKQSSAWDILSAIAERGRLGYKEEEQMIDHGLSLLTLHIMWKARGLTAATDPTPEEVSYRDKLKECRDSLVDRLIEFAAGTQSNTSDGVRRAAFQNLMNLHILFSPPQGDGNALPTAALALKLSEEVQARCTGFVQAEIERYAEELHDLAASDQDLSEEVGSDEHAERAGSSKPRKNGGKKKGRQASRAEPSGPTSRTQLEREYVFMGVISTFLRAIRAGVVHFQHSAVLLTHYARLGASFDLCAKVIVDILREEGMYKDNGELVAAVIFESLRESFALYLDRGMGTPDHTIALGKLCASCLTIRGAQLSVVRRLDSKYVISLHTTAISFICKRIASLTNKQKRNNALAFFKVLSPLLNHINARDALQIKAHLDQVMAQSKITPMTTNTWDPYHAYVKRLTSSKEKGSRGRKGKKDANRAGTTTTDEEDDFHEVHEEAGVPRDTRRPRPQPRAIGKATASGTDTEHEFVDEEHNPFLETGPITPKRKPRPPPISKTRSPSIPPTRSPSAPSSPLVDAEGSLSLSEPPKSPEPEPFATPAVSKKRQRTPDEESSVIRDVEGTPEVVASPEVPTPDEIQIRRKRVRH